MKIKPPYVEIWFNSIHNGYEHSKSLMLPCSPMDFLTSHLIKLCLIHTEKCSLLNIKLVYDNNNVVHLQCTQL